MVDLRGFTPQLTAVYAASQDEKRERRYALVHHTSDFMQSSLLRSPGFWLPTLPSERHDTESTLMRSLC